VRDIAGDLSAATACADAVERHLTIAVAIDPMRLEGVPTGQLVELHRAAADFEEAGLRVLGSLNPRVIRAAQAMAEVARAEARLTVPGAVEGDVLCREPLRAV
jgi:hypothetical protein